LTNPFEATIATTPPDLRPTLPTDDDINQSDYSLNLRPEREFSLPDNFWAVKNSLPHGQAGSRRAADLPDRRHRARFDSSINEYLKKLYYQAGYHVVQLSSPTSFDFIAPLRASPPPASARKTPKTCTG
jgi:hypothetical protein